MTVVKKAVAVNAAPQRGGSTPPGRSFENPLAGALWAVSKGMCVSPVTADQKFPPLTPWKETSTRNKADVLALAEKYPGCNWLIDCGKSTMAVLDEDVKNGKDGKHTTFMLALEHGSFDETTIVQTPSGGRQWYFWGMTRNSVQALGDGVDTRGQGGYVVCPGSTVGGVPYYLIREQTFQDLPAWVNDALKKRQSEGGAVEQVPVVDQDLDTSIAVAKAYLATTAPCIEGQGGDARLLQVAAKLKDIGISENTAVDLILEIFNERCEPSWDSDDVERKVANAFHYCRENAPGITSPMAMFPEDMSQDPFAVLVGHPRPTGPCRGRFMEEQERKRSRTVYDAPCLLTLTDIEDMTFNLNPPINGLVDECESLLILGANGAGKSLLSFDLALTLALPPKDGLLWGRFKIAKPLKTLVVQSEVTCKGLKNRNRKMCPPRSAEAAAADEMIRVASYGQSGRVTGDFMTPDFRKTLLGWINDFKPDVIIIDPLSSFHAQNENDSAEMRRTLDQLTAVCDEAGGLIHILVHHVGENSAGKGVFKGRGASSIGDWAANIVMLEEAKGGDSLQMTHLKARNFEKGRPIFFDRGQNLRLTPRAELATEGIDALLHDFLMEMGGEAVSKSRLIQRVREAKNVGRTKGTDIVNDAIARGVLKVGTGKGVAISILWNRSSADIFDDHEEVIGPNMA